MSTPPPYLGITGISRAVSKDNPQETLASYDGSARPGELVSDLTSTPPNLYIGDSNGTLHKIGPTIPGPYTSDADAALNGIQLGEQYYRPIGLVHVRIS